MSHILAINEICLVTFQNLSFFVFILSNILLYLSITGHHLITFESKMSFSGCRVM